jgi:hypothetical protein
MAAATIDADEAEPVELEDVYSPILFVECKGPEIGRLEQLDYLDFLYEKNQEFETRLKADGNLQRTFIEGLTNGAPADISSDFNETIENGIKKPS